MSINSVWNNFFDAEQQKQIMNTLGLNELPDPSNLTQTQLNTIDKIFGSGVSVQILSNCNKEVETKNKQTEDLAHFPDISSPTTNFDETSLINMLMVLREKVGKLMLNSAQKGVEINKDKLQTLNEQKIEKLKEVCEKLQTASNINQVSKVLGWVGSIAGAIISGLVSIACVGLGVAALCTGVGAGIGIGLIAAGVVAGASCALSIGGIGMMISDETGLTDKILDELTPSLYPTYKDILTKLPPEIQSLLKDWGLDGSEGLKTMLKLSVQAAFVVASLGVAAAGLIAGIVTGGASTAATVASTAANIAAQIAQAVVNVLRQIFSAVQALVQVAMAGLQITTASVNIAGTIQNFDVANTKAESKEYQAWLTKLQALMEDEQEALKKAYETLNNDLALCSEMLEDVFKSKNLIMDRMVAA